jgi:hypothetical protein
VVALYLSATLGVSGHYRREAQARSRRDEGGVKNRSGETIADEANSMWRGRVRHARTVAVRSSGVQAGGGGWVVGGGWSVESRE